ncbi:hypothetical protein OPV22_006064 [Ensete ventricosum]|uniref:RING-type E3 ubiquitin transferase n=1 Tax=Ensete ventricosum TaxID=4639 RepID=A0AAV8RNY0_ENSVE|nr:hypothetical protein OPV22_006064 [Ensete ventricosum]
MVLPVGSHLVPRVPSHSSLFYSEKSLSMTNLNDCRISLNPLLLSLLPFFKPYNLRQASSSIPSLDGSKSKAICNWPTSTANLFLHLPCLSHQSPPSSSSSVTYYVFVIKCWRGSGILRRLLSSAYSRRRGRHYMPPVVHTIMATEVRGLEPSVIRAIPIIKYTKARGDQRPFFHECAVCLSEFQEEERLKLLPNCSHGFHIDCVDTWLQFNARCPLCRSEVTSTAHLATDHVVVLPHRQDQLGENMVTQVRDEVSNQTPGATAAAPSPSTRKKGRKHLKAGSLGDECIDVRSEKEEQFVPCAAREEVSLHGLIQ